MNQVGARVSDCESNTAVVEIRLTRDEEIVHAHNQGVQVPTPDGGLSSLSTHTERTIMPLLDGPASTRPPRRQPLPTVKRTTIPDDDGFPDNSNSNSHDIRSRDNRRCPGRRYQQARGGGPPDGGGPPGNGRPPRRTPRRQGPPGPPGPPGPVCPIIVQQPQVTLDTTALENTFGTVGQSMLQLARAQDQTNRYLQEHLQQGQINMQAHTGALQQLATSTYQRNFDHIFASIPIYNGSNREDFFPWLEHLEAACFYSGRNIKTEALGRSAGPVQNVIMALPNAHSWKAIREELKRCFSVQTSLGHTAAQLENMTQKPNEPLRLYIFRYSKIHKSVTKRDACYDTDPSRWFRFLTSITNTTIADKITRGEHLPQNLQQSFEKAL